MRSLTKEELELICGGTDTASTTVVTVVAPPHYSSTHYTYTYTMSDDGRDGGGGGSSDSNQAHDTAGVSAEANAYADSHVHNEGSTDADKALAQKTHDDLAKLYDWAKNNPTKSVDIGNGHSVTGAQISADLNNINVHITDNVSNTSPAGDTGAATHYESTGNNVSDIFISPENSNIQSYANDPAGLDYVIFHELGHALDWAYDRSDMYNSDTGHYTSSAEALANSAGRSVENAIGIPLYQNPNVVYKD